MSLIEQALGSEYSLMQQHISEATSRILERSDLACEDEVTQEGQSFIQKLKAGTDKLSDREWLYALSRERFNSKVEAFRTIMSSLFGIAAEITRGEGTKVGSVYVSRIIEQLTFDPDLVRASAASQIDSASYLKQARDGVYDGLVKGFSLDNEALPLPDTLACQGVRNLKKGYVSRASQDVVLLLDTRYSGLSMRYVFPAETSPSGQNLVIPSLEIGLTQQ